jgi:curved DNA-binding protein CbpA
MDYYEILSVPRTASQTEIRNAYRKLAKLYHPDKNSSEHAKTYIQLINEAYETLSDPQKRSQYDQPVFTFVTPEVTPQPQKDPLEEQRKENFRRWQERERIKRQEEEEYKAYAFKQFKKFNVIIAVWALLLVLDEYALPPRTVQEEVLEATTVRTRRERNHLAKTESFVMAIPREAIEKSANGRLRIESSLVFNIPLRVATSDGSIYEVARNILAFLVPVPLLLLAFSLAIFAIKEPGNWSTFFISLQGIAILTVVALWLFSLSDKNAF